MCRIERYVHLNVIIKKIDTYSKKNTFMLPPCGRLSYCNFAYFPKIQLINHHALKLNVL